MNKILYYLCIIFSNLRFKVHDGFEINNFSYTYNQSLDVLEI